MWFVIKCLGVFKSIVFHIKQFFLYSKDLNIFIEKIVINYIYCNFFLDFFLFSSPENSWDLLAKSRVPGISGKNGSRVPGIPGKNGSRVPGIKNLIKLDIPSLNPIFNNICTLLLRSSILYFTSLSVFPIFISHTNIESCICRIVSVRSLVSPAQLIRFNAKTSKSLPFIKIRIWQNNGVVARRCKCWHITDCETAGVSGRGGIRVQPE